MDLAVPYEPVSLARPLNATKADYRLFAIFVFLSFFEWPVHWIGQDAIGLYDFYVLFLVLYLLFRTRGLTMRMPWAWRSYFLVFFAYLVYLFFELLYFNDFRSIAILFKFGEGMLVMSVLYTFFTQFDFDVKRIIRIVEINLVLLSLFQLYSFVDNLHHIGPFQPGLGVGLWYRLSMPFMHGVSPNPAGFVAGMFILLNLYARRRRLIGRGTFLLVTFLLTLTLVLTVSRTNLLTMIFILVVYLLRRSLKRTRYILLIAIFIVLVYMVINYLAETITPDNPLWLFVKLLKNPSDFLSKVSSDESFSLRYAVAWPHQVQLWLSNPFSFFFGKGIAFVPIGDGTYTSVLANQGVIGFAFFMYVWYFHFLSVWRKKLPFMWIMLLYAFINGWTFDTLVTSYRSMQPYFVVLFVMLFAFADLRERALGHVGSDLDGTTSSHGEVTL